RPSSPSRYSSTYFTVPAPAPAKPAPPLPGGLRRAYARQLSRSRRRRARAARRPRERRRRARSSPRRRPRRAPSAPAWPRGRASASPRRSTSRSALRRRSSSLDHARLQVLELLLVGVAQLLQELQRCARLLLVDLRERKADVDQHPVAGRRGCPVAVEEA